MMRRTCSVDLLCRLLTFFLASSATVVYANLSTPLASTAFVTDIHRSSSINYGLTEKRNLSFSIRSFRERTSSASVEPVILHRPFSSTNKMNLASGLPSTVLSLRGGGDVIGTVIGTLTSALQSGPWGVAVLWAIASSVVVPLTMVRQGFSFSVGYGFSVAAMGMATLLSFHDGRLPLDAPWTTPPYLLIASTIFYGLRLGSFLLIRILAVPSKAKSMKEFDKSPRLKRLPVALSVSGFYAFMVSPALYALRGRDALVMATSSLHSMVAYAGAATAWLGAMLEAIADWQKFFVKKRKGKSDEDKDKDDSTFVGPTGGVYRVCRHPNYLGEIVFWTGLLIGGVPYFGRNVVAWVCSSLGLYGIVSLMKGATKRLDTKQTEKYGGQKLYEDWKRDVPASLVPFIKE